METPHAFARQPQIEYEQYPLQHGDKSCKEEVQEETGVSIAARKRSGAENLDNGIFSAQDDPLHPPRKLHKPATKGGGKLIPTQPAVPPPGHLMQPATKGGGKLRPTQPAVVPPPGRMQPSTKGGGKLRPTQPAVPSPQHLQLRPAVPPPQHAHLQLATIQQMSTLFMMMHQMQQQIHHSQPQTSEPMKVEVGSAGYGKGGMAPMAMGYGGKGSLLRGSPSAIEGEEEEEEGDVVEDEAVGPTTSSVGAANSDNSNSEEDRFVGTGLVARVSPKRMPRGPQAICKKANLFLQFFSVGWEACGAVKQDDFDDLILKGRNCVSNQVFAQVASFRHSANQWFDCRHFNDCDKTMYGHVGENYYILQNIIDSGGFEIMLGVVKEWLRETVKATTSMSEKTDVKAGFVCTSGTQRSVAMLRLALECMRQDGFNVLEPRHLSTGTWKQRQPR